MAEGLGFLLWRLQNPYGGLPVHPGGFASYRIGNLFLKDKAYGKKQFIGQLLAAMSGQQHNRLIQV